MRDTSTYLAGIGATLDVHPLSVGAIVLLSAITAVLVCANGYAIGRATGLLDHPDGHRKLHARATPLVGGMGVMAAVVVACGLLVVTEPQVMPFLVGSGLLTVTAFAVGTADDHSGVCPWQRLIGLSIIATVAVVLTPIFNVRLLHSDLIGGQVGLWWLSVPFTVFSLMCLKNGLNMADGVNGLATGLALAWFGLMLPWAIDFAPEIVPIVLVAIAAMAVVFAFNWFGRVFLGDAGTYGLSFLAGTLAIYTYNSAGGALPAELVALWFLIPVLDMGRLLVQRVAGGGHPFNPDRNHFHHLLLDRLGPRGAVILYLALASFPPAFATVEPKLLPFAICASVAGYLGLLLDGRRRTVDQVATSAE